MRNSGPDGGSKRRLDERGQTLQDYALGIGLFSLVVVGVLSGTFTTALAPFDDGVGAGKQAQADRIAAEITANSTMEAPNSIREDRMHDITSMNQTELRERFDVPKTSRINISVRHLDGSTISTTFPISQTVDISTNLTTNVTAGEQAAATSARIIQVYGVQCNNYLCNNIVVSHSQSPCTPGCRLVVRVW